ncbi:MAG: response regulator [Oligoflexia bacterium]|nr:response regulator [Oligoflexia bacterium]
MNKFKALIIEDDKVALDYLAKFVESEGFEIAIAESAEEGLLKLKDEKADLLITDYKMNGMTGIEMIVKSKELNPNIQAVLVTAYGDTNMAIAAIQSGAVDYIKKPIDLQQIKIALLRAKEKIIQATKLVCKPNVLVVDDEEDARNYISVFLKKEHEGWNVFTAADGVAAVEAFKTKKMDVVLIDIKMPKMNGPDAISKIREEITSDFESIILTGHGDESDAIQALRNGAMNFLKKPIDLEEVLVNIEKALEKLKTKRTLLACNRENELYGQIIAKITNDNKFIIDTHQLLVANVAKFAEKLVEALPLAILLIDKNFKISYMNSHTMRLLDNPTQVDESFTLKLKDIGIECPLNKLENEILNMSKKEGTPIEKIQTGKHSYITLMQITLIDNQVENKTAILMGIRGEH